MIIRNPLALMLVLWADSVNFFSSIAMGENMIGQILLLSLLRISNLMSHEFVGDEEFSLLENLIRPYLSEICDYELQTSSFKFWAFSSLTNSGMCIWNTNFTVSGLQKIV